MTEQTPRFERPDSTGMGRVALWSGVLAALGLAVMPLDPAISRWAAGIDLGGDVRRELSALQQYGQASSIVLGAVLIWLLDPGRRRRLLDWLAGIAVLWVTVFGMKTLIGRPRPRLDAPYGFLWPWGRWDFGPPTGPRHAWEVGADISSDLWSMPSSHTAFAVLMSVFLTALYPRLRWFAVAMVVLVGSARVLFGAHYPSDVLVGAGVAFVLTTAAVKGFWGVRALDWIWVRLVDRDAAPAWPAAVAAERARRGGQAG